MLTLDTLESDTASIRAYIEQQWIALRRHARDGHKESPETLYALAETSTDGHLDD